MNIRIIVLLYGFSALIAGFLMFLITFFIAYMTDYSVIVYINNYREAHIEMIILLTSIPCICSFIREVTK